MAFGSSIIARLGLDSRDFREGLAQAKGALSGFASQLGVGLSVAGIAGYTRELIAYGSTIQDLSERFNVGTTALQQFGNAGELVGTSLEGVARGFNKLEISQSRALAGNQAQIKAFDNLGISVEDLRSLSPEAIMLKMGKSSLNAADMVTVLGKSALELRPLLQGLGDGSIKLGDAIDANIIRRLDEADDTFKKFGQTLKLFGAQAIDALALNFKGMAVDIEAMVKVIKEGFDPKNFNLQAQARNVMQFRDILAGRGPSKKMWDDYETERARGMVKDLHTPMELRNPKTASGAADQDKRLLLSLKDLAEKGPTMAHDLGGGRYAPNTGTAQSIYNADQARKVMDLEEQARRVNLTGISPTGESAEGLYNRADTIRQSIASYLKESDRGSLRSELDATNMAQNIAIMKDELQREEP